MNDDDDDDDDDFLVSFFVPEIFKFSLMTSSVVQVLLKLGGGDIAP